MAINVNNHIDENGNLNVGTFVNDLAGTGGADSVSQFFNDSTFGKALSALGIGDAFLQEQMQKDAEERQEQRQIDAEKRANEEYDRRMADERAYNDPTAQAARMRAAGINPMANLGQGVTSSSTKMSAPTQSSPSQSSPLGMGSIGITDIAQTIANIDKTKAETKFIEEQTSSKYEEGRAKWIENCWSEFLSGDRGNVVKTDRDFTIRYSAEVDDQGNITFVGLGAGKKREMTVECEKYLYNSDQYGTFAIYENGWAVRQLTQEFEHREGVSEKMAEELARSWCDLYFKAVESLSTGKQADASELKALADMMASQYLYGDEVTGKYILDQIFRAVGAGVDVYTAGKNAVKGKKKE